MAGISGRLGSFDPFTSSVIYGHGAPSDRKCHTLLLPDGRTKAAIQEKEREAAAAATTAMLRRKRALVGCIVCGEDDDSSNLLVCELCGAIECHTYCCTPPLKVVPAGEWLCHSCGGREKERLLRGGNAAAKAASGNAAGKKGGKGAAKGRGDRPNRGGTPSNAPGYSPLNRSKFKHIDEMFPEELWSVKRSYDGHYIFLSLENGKAFFKLSTAKEYLQSSEWRDMNKTRKKVSVCKEHCNELKLLL